ncbi:MAG: clostripain-related cysteine peptidase [Candidatus Muiribacteriota bacterium]
MRKFALVVILFLFLFSTVSFSQDVKEWTVMILINGDNNLSSYGADDIREMEQVGSTDDVNIVVEYDAFGNVPTKRYYIEESDNSSKITSPVVMEMPEMDTGDWEHVLGFFKWGADNYPAKKYLIAIWNHGAGWEDRRDCILTRGISYDDTSHNHIKTPELSLIAKGFSEHTGKKIDVLGYDACLMQMIEVAYEARGYVDYQIGAQETEPAYGWPYHKFLPPLVENPYMDGRNLVSSMVDVYKTAYSSGGTYGQKSTNQSAVDIDEVDLITSKVEGLAQVLIDKAPSFNSKYEDAIRKTQSYSYSQYKDLGHFCEIIIEMVDDYKVKSAAEDVLDAIDEFVVNSQFTASSVNNSNGISIYLPSKHQFDSKKESYSALKFSKVSKWDEFLSNLYYPNYPVITISEVVYSDEDGDGKVSPGERVNFNLKVKNDGNAASENLRAHLEYDGFDASVGNSSVNISSVDSLSEISVEGLYANISSFADENQELEFTLRVKGDNINSTESLKIIIKNPFEVNNDVLLITKDMNKTEYKNYIKALNDAQIKFDLWDNDSEDGKIPYTLLKKYINGVVVVPAPSTSGIDSVEIRDLQNYLVAGGNLFVSGQDIGYKHKGDSFYRDFLCAEYVQDNTGIHTLNGINGFDFNFDIKGGDGADNQKWPDEIEALEPALTIFVYKGSPLANRESKDNRVIERDGHGGLFVEKDNYKAVYLSFGFEAINSDNIRANLMIEIIEKLHTSFEKRKENLRNLAYNIENLNQETNIKHNIIKQNRAEEALFEMMKNDDSLELNDEDREIFGNVIDMINEYRSLK